VSVAHGPGGPGRLQVYWHIDTGNVRRSATPRLRISLSPIPPVCFSASPFVLLSLIINWHASIQQEHSGPGTDKQIDRNGVQEPRTRKREKARLRERIATTVEWQIAAARSTSFAHVGSRVIQQATVNLERSPKKAQTMDMLQEQDWKPGTYNVCKCVGASHPSRKVPAPPYL
jgi:hypothetical protein